MSRPDDGPATRVRCMQCHEWVTVPLLGAMEHFVDHVRVMHPDLYGDGPERWTDGGLVVEDCTLDPDDFHG